jgi:hypothetical protein
MHIELYSDLCLLGQRDYVGRWSWQLMEWKPSEVRRSGMYLPRSRPMTAARMERYLVELGCPEPAMAEFRRRALSGVDPVSRL